MIQRIQSIFLFLASAGFIGQFFTDFATSSASIPNLMSDKIYEVQDSPILLAITILGALIAFVAIFLYQNRTLQMKMCIFLIIMSIFLPLVAFLLMYNEGTSIAPGVTIEDSLGAYLPVVPLLFGILAYRGVKKDEGIVKSMDRLR